MEPVSVYKLFCDKYIKALEYRLLLEDYLEELTVFKTLDATQQRKYRYIREFIPNYRVADDDIDKKFDECSLADSIYKCVNEVLGEEYEKPQVYNDRARIKQMYEDHVVPADQVILMAHEYGANTHPKSNGDPFVKVINGTIVNNSVEYELDEGLEVELKDNPKILASNLFSSVSFGNAWQNFHRLNKRINHAMSSRFNPVTVILYGGSNSGKSEVFNELYLILNKTATFSLVQWRTTCGIVQGANVLKLENEVTDLLTGNILNKGSQKPMILQYDSATLKEKLKARSTRTIDEKKKNTKTNISLTTSVVFLTAYHRGTPVLSVVDLPGNDIERYEDSHQYDINGLISDVDAAHDIRGCNLALDLFEILIKNKQSGGIMMCDPTATIGTSAIEEVLLGQSTGPLIDKIDHITPEVQVELGKLYGKPFSSILTAYQNPKLKPFAQHIHPEEGLNIQAISLNKTTNIALHEFKQNTYPQKLYGFPLLHESERLGIKRKIQTFLNESGHQTASLFDMFKELRLCDDALLGILNQKKSKLIVVASVTGQKNTPQTTFVWKPAFLEYSNEYELVKHSNERTIEFCKNIPASKIKCSLVKAVAKTQEELLQIPLPVPDPNLLQRLSNLSKPRPKPTKTPETGDLLKRLSRLGNQTNEDELTRRLHSLRKEESPPDFNDADIEERRKNLMPSGQNVDDEKLAEHFTPEYRGVRKPYVYPQMYAGTKIQKCTKRRKYTRRTTS